MTRLRYGDRIRRPGEGGYYPAPAPAVQPVPSVLKDRHLVTVDEVSFEALEVLGAREVEG